MEDLDCWSNMASTKKRRVINTHLPYNLLPQQLLTSSDHKMIYVFRNPKDAAISWYHHFKSLHHSSIELSTFLACMLRGDMFWGSYFQHVDEFLRLAETKTNLLVISYEALVSNTAAEIQKVATFLDISLSEENVKKVADYIHFDQMKNRSRSNRAEFSKALNGEENGSKESTFK